MGEQHFFDTESFLHPESSGGSHSTYSRHSRDDAKIESVLQRILKTASKSLVKLEDPSQNPFAEPEHWLDSEIVRKDIGDSPHEVENASSNLSLLEKARSPEGMAEKGLEFYQY